MVVMHFVANSFLHIIVARPKILPYIDMIRWVIDNLDITDRLFLTPKKKIIGSFKVEYLRKIYHIPPPQKR